MARERRSPILHRLPRFTERRDLHIALACLGDADQLPGHPDDLASIVTTALDGATPLSGKIGGIGRFPDEGIGEPVFVPVGVPGLIELRERIIRALSLSPLSGTLRTDHGFTPHITPGYGLPAGTPAAAPLPVAFDTVHVVLGLDTITIRLTGDQPRRASHRAGFLKRCKLARPRLNRYGTGFDQALRSDRKSP
ncbi:2'-5' RNA ligase family protein [Streptomyces sp. SAI-129]|uniref:2'-5' RNA ligase family protein n=1 Tax=Streptomyces sp. SAI-129 TaxID=3377727 RepID=UPI003C7E4CA3